MASPVV